MKVVKLTKDERKKLWEKLPSIFREKDATRQGLRMLSMETGYNTRFLEVMLWQLDTLYLLKDYATELVWKGGTCVQSYAPEEYQRYSTDLDINTNLDANGIIETFEELNERLQEEGKVHTVENMLLGGFNIVSRDEHIGVINVIRLVPTKHGGEYTKQGVKILDVIPLKVQLNYGIHENTGITAIEIIPREPKLIAYKMVKQRFNFPHESPGDLLADKIIAMAEIKGIHRGRLRIKDAYDVILLTKIIGVDYTTTLRKLETIAEWWGVNSSNIVKKAIDALRELSEKKIEVLGFKGAVGEEGLKKIVNNWEGEIMMSTETLEAKLL